MVGSSVGSRGSGEKGGRCAGEAQGLCTALDPTPEAGPAAPGPSLLPALDHSQHPRQLQPLLPIGR